MITTLAKDHGHGVYSLAASRSNKEFLFAGHRNGQILKWHISSNTSTELASEHSGLIWGLDVSDDGTLLASGGDDKTMVIWDANTGNCNRVASIILLPEWHKMNEYYFNIENDVSCKSST